MQPTIEMQPIAGQPAPVEPNPPQTTTENTTSTTTSPPSHEPITSQPSGPPPPYSPAPTNLQEPQHLAFNNLGMNPSVGSKPTIIICRACRAEIITRVEFKPSIRTHLMAALLCVIGLWCCVCVPYCIETCNSVDHFCPNCGSYVGTYRN